MLEKSGRTTGVTRGKVDGFGAYTIPYSVGERTVEGFKIISVLDGNPNNEEISSGGDSGSVWYSSTTQEGIGLHFAGETNPTPNEEHAIACHLPTVLTALNISLVPPTDPRQAMQVFAEAAVSSLQQVIDNNLSIPYGDIATSPLAQNRQLCREIQQILANNNFYRDTVDSDYGRNTREALRDFKEAYALGGGDVLGPTTAEFLLRIDRPQNDGNYDLSTLRGTQQAIIRECRRQGLSLNTQIAYVLATVEHETANTFKPVKEAFWLSEDWRRRNLSYYPYYGRGYVQLTLRGNYALYGGLLGIDLVGNPDRALDPKTALFILVDGMLKGRYTTKRLGQYINASRTDRVNARQVVNDSDRAVYIAGLAQNWESRISSLESVATEVMPEMAALPFIDESAQLSAEQLLEFKRIMSS